MPVIFNAIAAHPQANSYISLEEANQYFENRDNSANWTAATDDQKRQALIEGTRRVDANRFKDEPLKSWQALEFPRVGGRYARVESTSVDSATVNTIVDASLQNVVYMPDDFWKYGTVAFLSRGQSNFMGLYQVSGFVASTGIITVSQNFAVVPSVSDGYQLIREIPREIKYATCETAIAVIEDAVNVIADPNVKRQQLGDESIEYFDKSSRGISIPSVARQMISPYVSRSGSIKSVPKFR